MDMTCFLNVTLNDKIHNSLVEDGEDDMEELDEEEEEEEEESLDEEEDDLNSDDDDDVSKHIQVIEYDVDNDDNENETREEQDAVDDPIAIKKLNIANGLLNNYRILSDISKSQKAENGTTNGHGNKLLGLNGFKKNFLKQFIVRTNATLPKSQLSKIVPNGTGRNSVSPTEHIRPSIIYVDRSTQNASVTTDEISAQNVMEPSPVTCSTNKPTVSSATVHIAGDSVPTVSCAAIHSTVSNPALIRRITRAIRNCAESSRAVGNSMVFPQETRSSLVKFIPVNTSASTENVPSSAVNIVKTVNVPKLQLLEDGELGTVFASSSQYPKQKITPLNALTAMTYDLSVDSDSTEDRDKAELEERNKEQIGVCKITSRAISTAEEDLHRCKAALIQASLRNHLPSHNVPKCYTGPTFSCAVCKDTFVSEDTLERHKDRRTALFTYMCPVCDISLQFFNKCTFLAHVRKHNIPIFAKDITITSIPADMLNLKYSSGTHCLLENKSRQVSGKENRKTSIVNDRNRISSGSSVSSVTKRKISTNGDENILTKMVTIEISEKEESNVDSDDVVDKESNMASNAVPSKVVPNVVASDDSVTGKSLQLVADNNEDPANANTMYLPLECDISVAENVTIGQDSNGNDQEVGQVKRDKSELKKNEDENVEETVEKQIASAICKSVRLVRVSKDKRIIVGKRISNGKNNNNNNIILIDKKNGKSFLIKKSGTDNFPSKPSSEPAIIADSDSEDDCSIVPETAKLTENPIEISDDEDETKEGRIMCFECGKLTPNLQIHFKGRGIPRAIHRCSICAFLSPTVCSMSAHFRIHMKNPPYHCPDCAIRFPDTNTFMRHVSAVCYYSHKTIRLQCPECGALFNSTRRLSTHFCLAHAKRVYKCDVCSFVTRRRNIMEMHLKQSHSADEDVSAYAVGFNCGICRSPFLPETELGVHLSKHSLNADLMRYVYLCTICRAYAHANVRPYIAHYKQCSEYAALSGCVEQNYTEESISATAESNSSDIPVVDLEPDSETSSEVQSTQNPNAQTSTSSSSASSSASSSVPSSNPNTQMSPSTTESHSDIESSETSASMSPSSEYNDSQKVSASEQILTHSEEDSTGYSSASSLSETVYSEVATSNANVPYIPTAKTGNCETSSTGLSPDESVEMSSRTFVSETNPEISPSVPKSTEDAKNIRDSSCEERNVGKDVVVPYSPNKRQRSQIEIEEIPAKIPKLSDEEMNSSNKNNNCIFSPQKSTADVLKSYTEHPKNRPSQFRCSVCGECFVVRPSLEKHLIIKHKIRSPMVGRTLPNQIPNLIKKVPDNVGENQCSVCFLQCSSRRNYEKHLRTHCSPTSIRR